MKTLPMRATLPGATPFPAAAGRKAAVFATFLLAVAGLAADDISIDSCPDPVKATILAHFREGKLDEIKRLEIEDRVLYLVEIDLKGFRDLTLHINGTGKLLKRIEEIRLPELPQAARDAVARALDEKGHVEEVERIFVDGRTEYRVEIGRPKAKDVVFVFAEDGTLLSQK